MMMMKNVSAICIFFIGKRNISNVTFAHYWISDRSTGVRSLALSFRCWTGLATIWYFASTWKEGGLTMVAREFDKERERGRKKNLMKWIISQCLLACHEQTNLNSKNRSHERKDATEDLLDYLSMNHHPKMKKKLFSNNPSFAFRKLLSRGKVVNFSSRPSLQVIKETNERTLLAMHSSFLSFWLFFEDFFSLVD